MWKNIAAHNDGYWAITALHILSRDVDNYSLIWVVEFGQQLPCIKINNLSDDWSDKWLNEDAIKVSKYIKFIARFIGNK